MTHIQFTPGDIVGVVIRPMTKHTDERGWLLECFRNDQLPPEMIPPMAYISMTRPDIVRGPHEHRDQSDNFVFFGPSTFKIYLWDTRPESATRGHKMVLYAGESKPTSLIVPPGVVHAYKNVGDRDGLVFNAPNRLFAGADRQEPVDEIRHEDTTDSPFVLD